MLDKSREREREREWGISGGGGGVESIGNELRAPTGTNAKRVETVSAKMMIWTEWVVLVEGKPTSEIVMLTNESFNKLTKDEDLTRIEIIIMMIWWSK